MQGIYDYPASLTVFMPISSYRKTFGEKEDYFNGYFSREKITDLDEDLIATTITEDDLTKEMCIRDRYDLQPAGCKQCDGSGGRSNLSGSWRGWCETGW